MLYLDALDKSFKSLIDIFTSIQRNCNTYSIYQFLCQDDMSKIATGLILNERGNRDPVSLTLVHPVAIKYLTESIKTHTTRKIITQLIRYFHF